MRILHLTKFLPGFAGGIEQVTNAMAFAGVASGAEVEVIGVAGKQGESPIAVTPGYRQIPLRPHLRVGTVPIVIGFFGLDKRIRAADVIHLHLPNPWAELALLAAMRSHKSESPFPLIAPVIHAPIRRWPALARVWTRWIHQPIYDASTTLIVASDLLVELLERSGLCFNREKLRVLPFGVEKPLSVAAGAARGPTIRLLTIGRLVGYKGLPVLFEAVRGLPGDWHLDIVGTGPNLMSLRRRANKLGLERRVTFWGVVGEEQKHALLAACDIFVLPSQSEAESFGLVAGEAFAHRKPVVTTRLQTGLSYLSRNGECGAVVPVGSPEALRTAISYLMSNEHERNAAGQRNFQFWQNELRMDLFESRYRDLLGEIMKQSGSHRSSG